MGTPRTGEPCPRQHYLRPSPDRRRVEAPADSRLPRVRDVFDERRIHFLRDRVQRRLKACQIESFYGYYRLLTSREGKTELIALLENLTVNETSFFRAKPQLELFQKTTLEELLHRKQARRDWSLRIWSAGCSTGQEPYTLGHDDLRCPRLLLSPKPAPRGDALAQTDGSTALEGGSSRE